MKLKIIELIQKKKAHYQELTRETNDKFNKSKFYNKAEALDEVLKEVKKL